MTRRVYWGLGVLILLIIIGACYIITKPSVQEPETITYKGETFTLQEFYWNACSKSWGEKVPMLRHIIAAFPYSEESYFARRDFARHVDENSIVTHALLYERLQPLLKYHPDSPNLLLDLLIYGRSIDPEAAIRYGKKALKNIDRHHSIKGSSIRHRYSATPEKIHKYLGYAYEELGDYDTALEYLNQALNLYKSAKPQGYLNATSLIRFHIKHIHEGNPVSGPLSDGTVSTPFKVSNIGRIE